MQKERCDGTIWKKYGDTVRVLTMGKNEFSVELCGGTHVNQLGDIGLFRIISESSVSAGVRRIEALTGYDAYQFDNQIQNSLNKIAQITRSSNTQVVGKVMQLIKQQKN